MSPQYTQMIIFILMITQIALIFAQSTSCNAAYECVGTNWTLSSGQNIYGRGYKSLSGSSTSITSNYSNTYILCYGAYSCAEILFILSQWDVYCSGSHSCHNTKMINANNNLYCIGSNSCSNSNINSNYLIYCYGDQSCNFANISSPIIYALGSYSLYGSTIDTNFIAGGILTIYLYGYQSGFGANIICRSGDICNIYCYFNGCQMLYVICEDIDNNNCDITLNSNDPSITIPPIHNKNEFVDSMYDLKYINNKTDGLCNDSANIFVYDNFRQQESVNMNISDGGPVCCRGYESCGYNGAIQFTATTTDILVCSAYNSCSYSSIITKGATFCEGYGSCFSTNIYGSDNVYCLGYMACAYGVITESKNIYCSASRSCYNGQIESNGTNVNIYLLGYFSGDGLHVYCEIGDECVITCGAYRSCQANTILDCNNNCVVYCNDDTGCPVGDYTMITLRSSTAPSTQSPSTPSPTETPSNAPTSSPTQPPSSARSTAPTYPPSNAPSSSPTACPDYDISMLILILILCVFQF